MAKIYDNFGNMRRGFTLIELLVTISIISIVASLLAGNFINSQKRGYDAKRQGDMRTIQSAFEQYFAVNGVYPVNDTEAGSAFPSTNIPTDPRGNSPYIYARTYTGGTSYCVCAALEIIIGNATDTSCTYGTGETAINFCVSNLQ